MLKSARGRTRHDPGFVLFALVVLLVLCGMLFFLYRMRVASEAEGEQFAREVIERCVFRHDVAFLHSVVAASRRLAVPPAKDQEFIDALTSLGLPDRNYKLTGAMEFDNYFLSPHGTFKSILAFPDRHGTILISVARPSGVWLVTDYGILWERPPD